MLNEFYTKKNPVFSARFFIYYRKNLNEITGRRFFFKKN